MSGRTRFAFASFGDVELQVNLPFGFVIVTRSERSGRWYTLSGQRISEQHHWTSSWRRINLRHSPQYFGQPELGSLIDRPRPGFLSSLLSRCRARPQSSPPINVTQNHLSASAFTKACYAQGQASEIHQRLRLKLHCRFTKSRPITLGSQLVFPTLCLCVLQLALRS